MKFSFQKIFNISQVGVECDILEATQIFLVLRSGSHLSSASQLVMLRLGASIFQSFPGTLCCIDRTSKYNFIRGMSSALPWYDITMQSKSVNQYLCVFSLFLRFSINADPKHYTATKFIPINQPQKALVSPP